MQKQHVKQTGKKISVEHLLLSLLDQEKAVCYYKLLSLAVRFGVKIKRVHHGITFQEKRLFEKFVRHNLKRRKDAMTKAEEANAKLGNNLLTGVYFEIAQNPDFDLTNNNYPLISGRILLDASSYNNKKFVSTSVSAIRNLADDDFRNFDVYGDRLVLFDMKKKRVVNNGIRLVGLVILSNAKFHLLNLIFNRLLPAFNGRGSIIMSHTDSVLISVVDPDRTFISTLRAISDIFDFSNLDKEHPLYDGGKHRQKEGLLKLVADGILEFFGNSPSEYSLKLCEKMAGKSGDIKCSGIKKAVAGANLKHQMFKDFVMTCREQPTVEIPIVRYKNCEILNFKMERKGIGAIDLKRYFINNEKSYAYGDYRIPNGNNTD